MAFWDRITGLIVAAGVGGAAADALVPVLETARQQAWGQRAYRVLDPTTAASAVAAGVPNPRRINYADDAKRSGIGAARFETMVELAHHFPDLGDLLALRRRGTISPEAFDAALERQHIPDPWRSRLLVLAEEKLSPADVANAVQQGFLPPAGILPDPTPPTPDWQLSDGPFRIPAEQVAIPPETEAATWGIDGDRLTVLTELAGLPPGEETLLELWRRRIIGPAGYASGLREGHTKTKWTAALSARFWQLLPPSVLVNLRLRGWIDDAAYHDRMRLHGFRPEAAGDWFHSAGRPATVHQAMLGLRRGGIYEAPLTDTPQPYRDAVIRSDLRPEWANLLYAGRETYPSAFVVRRLVEGGDFTAAEGADLLYKAGWNRALADKAGASFAAGTATTAKGLTAGDLATEYEGGFIDRATFINELAGLGYAGPAAAGRASAIDARRARTFRNAVLSRHQAAYDRYRLTDTEAVIALGELGVVADVAQAYVALWREYRAAKTAELTAAQVRKAFASNIYDRATALSELEERGYTVAEANVYLDE